MGEAAILTPLRFEKMSGTKPWAVALMAGGKSTRMGQDKARLVDGAGRELWQGRLDLLRELGAGEVMISCREDQRYLAGSGARLVFDRWKEAGPLGGIVSCLEAMEAPRLLVLGVDLPGVTRKMLECLLEAAAGGIPRGIPGGAVFRRDGFLEPLVAVYPGGMAVSGRRRLEAGEFSLHGWIGEAGEVMRVLPLPAEWAGALINVNDPAGWAAWRAGGG